jgi:hypothetical protein
MITLSILLTILYLYCGYFLYKNVYNYNYKTNWGTIYLIFMYFGIFSSAIITGLIYLIITYLP